MYLLWLRVAAVLYAAGSVAVIPAVLYRALRWRSICVHVAGLALFFHFVSVVEMLVQAHRWMPVGAREIESLLGFAVAGLFFLVWWLYDAISLGIFALPATFLLVLVPALGPGRYVFPSEGVRMSWLVAHIIALLLAYAALCFSLLASVLYLVQERRIKAKLKPGRAGGWAPLNWLPPLDTLERIALATLEFGLPCMTVGLIIGSVLAQETALGAAGVAAAARHPGADCTRHAGIRISVHDGGAGTGSGAGAGDIGGSGLSARPPGDGFVRKLGHLRRAAFDAAAGRGTAGTQGGLCFGSCPGGADGGLVR